MKVKDYTTLCVPWRAETAEGNVQALEELDKAVKALLKEGWEPIGGVSACTTPRQGLVFQAMVLHEDVRK